MAWVRIPPLPRSFGPAAAVAPFRGEAPPGAGGQPLEPGGGKLRCGRGQRPPAVRPGTPKTVRNGDVVPAPGSRPAVPHSLGSSGLLTPPASAFASFPPALQVGRCREGDCWDKPGSGRGRWQQSPPQPSCGEGFSCVVIRNAGCSFSQLQGFAQYNCCPLRIKCKTLVVSKV